MGGMYGSLKLFLFNLSATIFGSIVTGQADEFVNRLPDQRVTKQSRE